MKILNIFYITVITIGVCIMMLSSVSAQTQPTDMGTFKKLSLGLEIERCEYLPGEPIKFTVQVKNGSVVPIIAHKKIAVGYGYLQILVAYNGSDYKKYLGPQWGIKDSYGYFVTTLEPGESMTASASILYNHPTRTRKSISTRYALLSSGTYSVKAVFHNLGFGEKIESNEIILQLREPERDDAAVWQAMKRFPQYGCFIQTGGATLEAVRIAAALKDIIETYPGTGYSEHITSALKKYNSQGLK